MGEKVDTTHIVTSHGGQANPSQRVNTLIHILYYTAIISKQILQNRDLKSH